MKGKTRFLVYWAGSVIFTASSELTANQYAALLKQEGKTGIKVVKTNKIFI